MAGQLRRPYRDERADTAPRGEATRALVTLRGRLNRWLRSHLGLVATSAGAAGAAGPARARRVVLAALLVVWVVCLLLILVA